MAKPKTEFITVNDIARLTNINKSRVNFWVSKGLIKERGTLGKAKYFDKEYALRRASELVKERSQ